MVGDGCLEVMLRDRLFFFIVCLYCFYCIYCTILIDLLLFKNITSRYDVAYKFCFTESNLQTYKWRVFMDEKLIHKNTTFQKIKPFLYRLDPFSLYLQGVSYMMYNLRILMYLLFLALNIILRLVFCPRQRFSN